MFRCMMMSQYHYSQYPLLVLYFYPVNQCTGNIIFVNCRIYWRGLISLLSICSLENLQQNKWCCILAALAKGWKIATGTHLTAFEFPLASWCPKLESLVQETDIARISPPRGKPINVSRSKGAMLHYEQSGLGWIFFSLWNWFLYL